LRRRGWLLCVCQKKGCHYNNTENPCNH
jgi:hypothetical protein